MNIGDAVKIIRKRRELSQKDLAHLIGISSTYLSQIENNQKIPKIHLIEKIGSNLGVPIPVLLFLSLTENDVKDAKKSIFREIYPFLRSSITSIFLDGN